MTVLIVMPQGKIAGAERVLLELLAARPRGVVGVCAPSSSNLAKEVRRLGYPVFDFSVPKLRDSRSVRRYTRAYVRSVAQVWRHVAETSPDVIHSFLPLALKSVAP